MTQKNNDKRKPSTSSAAEKTEKVRKALPKTKELKNTSNLKQVGGKKYFMTPTDCC